MFDPNNQTHLNELNAEVTNDPTGIGLEPMPAKSSGDNAAIINEIRGSIQVDVERVLACQMMSAVVTSEFLARTDGEQRMWIAMMSAHAGDINPKDQGLRDQIIALWPGGTTTRSNLAALQTRDGSRAEQLWGVNSNVTNVHINLAFGIS